MHVCSFLGYFRNSEKLIDSIEYPVILDSENVRYKVIPIHDAHTLFNLLVILWFILLNYRYYCNRSFKENVNRAHALAQAHRGFSGGTIKRREKYIFSIIAIKHVARKMLERCRRRA